MNVTEMNELPELNATELAEVEGGLWPILVAFGFGMGCGMGIGYAAFRDTIWGEPVPKNKPGKND